MEKTPTFSEWLNESESRENQAVKDLVIAATPYTSENVDSIIESCNDFEEIVEGITKLIPKNFIEEWQGSVELVREKHDKKKKEDDGFAMEDGSNRVESLGDLKKCVKGYDEDAENAEEVKKHLKKRAKALGGSSYLPKEW